MGEPGGLPSMGLHRVGHVAKLPQACAEFKQESQASSCVWRNGTLLASPVVHGVTGHFSSCVWYLRVSPDDTQGCQCP